MTNTTAPHPVTFHQTITPDSDGTPRPYPNPDRTGGTIRTHFDVPAGTFTVELTAEQRKSILQHAHALAGLARVGDRDLRTPERLEQTLFAIGLLQAMGMSPDDARILALR